MMKKKKNSIYSEGLTCQQAAERWITADTPGRRINVRNFVAKRSKESSRRRWQTLLSAIDEHDIERVRRHADGKFSDRPKPPEGSGAPLLDLLDRNAEKQGVIDFLDVMHTVVENGRWRHMLDVRSVGEVAAFCSGVFDALYDRRGKGLLRSKEDIFVSFVESKLNITKSSKAGAAFISIRKDPEKFLTQYRQGNRYAQSAFD